MRLQLFLLTMPSTADDIASHTVLYRTVQYPYTLILGLHLAGHHDGQTFMGRPFQRTLGTLAWLPLPFPPEPNST